VNAFQEACYELNPGVQPIFLARDCYMDHLVGFYLKDKSVELLKKPTVIFAGESGKFDCSIHRDIKINRCL
jgi:hypothetical protein